MKQILTIVWIFLTCQAYAQLGSTTGNGIVNINGNTNTYSSSILRLVKWSNNNAHIDVMDGKNLMFNYYSGGHVYFGTAANSAHSIFHKTGKLGINTLSLTSGFHLDVNGKSKFRNDIDVTGDAHVSNYLHVKGGRLYAYRDSDNWGVVYSKHFESPANQPLHLNYYSNSTTTVGIGGGNFEVKNNMQVGGKINNRLSLIAWGNPSYGHTNTSLVMNGIRKNGQWEVLGDGARTSIGVISTDIFGNIRIIAHHDPSVSNSKTMTDDQLFGGNTRMMISSSGNVGIGTTSTFGYKLAVNGSIGSREVTVENTSPWPDFVFQPDYELRPLNEVANYVAQHQHLPEIPSQEEVAENGINLGEMNAKLLQKIEELTLYLIEEHQTNQKLLKEVEVLKKKVNQLESQ